MSRSDVPDWVRLACNRWGRQKRRMWQGKESYINSEKQQRTHVDGYAESFMGRIKDERVAAGQTSGVRQHWDEVYWGEGLEVQRAIVGMPATPYDVLHLKYVWDPDFGLSWAARARVLELKERAFWEALGRAEFWVFARLESTVHTQASETAIEISAGLLKKAPKTVRIVAHEITSSEVSLNFTALKRPKISVIR